MHIYAEYLLSIHTLSVQINLDSPFDSETDVTISFDGRSLAVSHSGERRSARLPMTLPPRHRGKLQVPGTASAQLQYRFQIVEELPSYVDSSAIVPWTAADLSESAEMTCEDCDAVIVIRKVVRQWKDLPSENWAEMMDFWHCHKPNEPHTHDHTSNEKGYAAQSRLTAQRGIGLVNATSFLLAAEDCSNLKLANSPPEVSSSSSGEQTLRCAACDTAIGTFDEPTQSYKLAKLTLALKLSPSNPRQSFSSELWLSCRLLHAAESQGLRKFTLTTFSKSERLLVWLFTPDLHISSSSTATPEISRVAKILWKCVPASDDTQGAGMDSQSLAEGEMELPSFEFTALRLCLEGSETLLPQSARQLMGWNVGLLQRFSHADTTSD